MLLCSPIYWNMISSHYSNGDPSPPTANQSLLRLKLFCLKRKNPEVSPVNCKKSWSSNETTTTIQRDPPKPPKHIKQSECHIRNSMPPPKKYKFFFVQPWLPYFGVQHPTAMFWWREAPKGSSSPWATCWGANLGAWSMWNLERCCQALWTSDGKLWWLKSGEWNLVNIG